VRIRPAKSGDAAIIEELVQRAYAHYVSRIGGRPGPMDDDYGERVSRGLVSVAEDAGEIVGLIVLAGEADHLLIENVAVDPTRQGEGIGRPDSWGFPAQPGSCVDDARRFRPTTFG